MENFTCIDCGFTEYTTELKSQNLVARCKKCGKFWKNIPQDSRLKIHFGKFKGTFIDEMTTPDAIQYLSWLITTDIYAHMTPRYKEAIQNVLN
jgi:hypothetical protein